ncbi:hypothetical protein [Geminocystis sp. GBBB08]|uniref:hypothetical protein n=1 Tax=Geminocystis sp. GBBB08 TaxID=2604140 RepID=UPI0027E3317E|nr:hypothetical protein [Geminocystis sp. GBBB08]
MLIINQFFFLFKVLFVSTVISILIKYGLDNSLIQQATYLAPIIIFAPVIIIFITLIIRQNIKNQKKE